MNDPTCVVIDASLRFARSNPELVRYARAHLTDTGPTVDDLLLQAIGRVVALRRADAPRARVPGGAPLLRAL